MVGMALGIVRGSDAGRTIMATRRESVNAALAGHKGTRMTDKRAQEKTIRKRKLLKRK